MVVVVIKNLRLSIHSIPVQENFSLTSLLSEKFRLLIGVCFRKLIGANQAPKKGEQISHRFQEFLDNKKHGEELAKKKKNKNKFKPTSEHPELEQKTNESDRNYLERLNQVENKKN